MTLTLLDIKKAILDHGGFELTHRSRKDGRISSYYFENTDGYKIRVSDHELGETIYGERQGGWLDLNILVENGIVPGNFGEKLDNVSDVLHHWIKNEGAIPAFDPLKARDVASATSKIAGYSHNQLWNTYVATRYALSELGRGTEAIIDRTALENGIKAIQNQMPELKPSVRKLHHQMVR